MGPFGLDHRLFVSDVEDCSVNCPAKQVSKRTSGRNQYSSTSKHINSRINNRTNKSNTLVVVGVVIAVFLL